MTTQNFCFPRHLLAGCTLTFLGAMLAFPALSTGEPLIELRPSPDSAAIESAAAQRPAMDDAVRKIRTEEAQLAAKETSSWERLLAMVGLFDDRSYIPPQEGAGDPGRPESDYVIGAGDQLSISVWRDDALTRNVTVLPDGKIQFPLVGEVVASGKTVAQLRKEFEDVLSEYIVEAGLSVEVRQPASLFVYVIGKVNVPGRHMMINHTNVLQVLALAGGLNPFAERDNIRIFRQEGERTIILPFRYSMVSTGRHLEENIWLKRGDVIVVP